jgi:hypothetical protein
VPGVASMTRLPESYVPATWRNVTPVDAEAGAIGIGLNLPSGTVRVALGIDGARQLAEALTEYLDSYGYRRAHNSDCPVFRGSAYPPKLGD